MTWYPNSWPLNPSHQVSWFPHGSKQCIMSFSSSLFTLFFDMLRTEDTNYTAVPLHLCSLWLECLLLSVQGSCHFLLETFPRPVDSVHPFTPGSHFCIFITKCSPLVIHLSNWVCFWGFIYYDLAVDLFWFSWEFLTLCSVGLPMVVVPWRHFIL